MNQEPGDTEKTTPGAERPVFHCLSGCATIGLAFLAACSAPHSAPEEPDVRAIVERLLADTPGVNTQLDAFTLYGCHDIDGMEWRCDVSYTVTVQVGENRQTNSDGGVITVAMSGDGWQLAD